jgi:hypothetical protein
VSVRSLYVDDLTGSQCGLEEAADVGAVAGDDVGAQVGGCPGDDGGDDIAGCGTAHELAGSGVISHPRRSRRSWTPAGERLTWAMTGAGTTGMMPASSRIR